MEKLIRKRIIQHMDKFDLFSIKQFGFMGGRSTTLQLLKVLDHGDFVVFNSFNSLFTSVNVKLSLFEYSSYCIFSSKTVLLRQGQYLKDGELAKLQHYSRKEVRTLHQTTDQLALLASYVS
jgi:hypothetical protein